MSQHVAQIGSSGGRRRPTAEKRSKQANKAERTKPHKGLAIENNAI